MIRVLNIIILSISVILFYSCKTYKVLKHQEEYSNDKLFMDEIYFVNCVKNNCDTNLTDSLVVIMKDALSDLKLNIIYQDTLANVYNDTIWRDTFPPKLYSQRKVNFDYFKQYPYDYQGLKLVPFLNYRERYGFSSASNTFTISINLAMFIIDDQETIYHVDSWISNTTHYVPSIDDFKKEDINTSEFIKPVIYKALASYIERSGNGRIITR